VSIARLEKMLWEDHMSLENVEKFYAKLGEDKALLEKVTKAAEGLKNKFKTKEEQEDKGIAETYLVLEPFARELNCAFTIDELKEYGKQKAKVLSDEQLDAVAGGVCACAFVGAGTNVDGSAASCGCAVLGGGEFTADIGRGPEYAKMACPIVGFGFGQNIGLKA
jgi:hypothetical protein